MTNAGHNDPKFTDEPAGYYRPGVTDDADDTEGHRVAFITDDGSTDGPDGFKAMVTDEGDDTEGHRLVPNVTDDGTVPNAPEGYRALMSNREGDDDGSEGDHLMKL